MSWTRAWLSSPSCQSSTLKPSMATLGMCQTGQWCLLVWSSRCPPQQLAICHSSQETMFQVWFMHLQTTGNAMLGHTIYRICFVHHVSCLLFDSCVRAYSVCSKEASVLLPFASVPLWITISLCCCQCVPTPTLPFPLLPPPPSSLLKLPIILPALKDESFSPNLDGPNRHDLSAVTNVNGCC